MNDEGDYRLVQTRLVKLRLDLREDIRSLDNAELSLQTKISCKVIGEDGKHWIVDLDRRCCTCLMFQEHRGHVNMAARARRIDPYALF